MGLNLLRDRINKTMARPLATTEPRPTTSCSNQPGKPNHIPSSDRPGMGRNRSLTANFPNFCPCFQLRTNQGKPNMFPKPITQDARLLVSPPPASPCQHPPIRAYLKLSLFLAAGLSVPTELREGGWLPCYSYLCFHLLLLFLFISTQPMEKW